MWRRGAEPCVVIQGCTIGDSPPKRKEGGVTGGGRGIVAAEESGWSHTDGGVEVKGGGWAGGRGNAVPLRCRDDGDGVGGGGCDGVGAGGCDGVGGGGCDGVGGGGCDGVEGGGCVGG